MKNTFDLKLPFEPAGDQPKAIKSLLDGLKKGMHKQTLLGVTGSGKILSRKCCALFCFILRLLSAGSIYAYYRYFYRKRCTDK